MPPPTKSSSKPPKDPAIDLPGQPFPSNNPAAISVWLADIRNRQFNAFNSATPARLGPWSNLFTVFRDVTGLEDRQWEACFYKACGENLDSGPSHVSLDVRRDVADNAAQEIINTMTTPWKTNTLEWTKAASRVLIPRMIHNWKRKERRKQAPAKTGGPEEQKEALESEPEQPPKPQKASIAVRRPSQSPPSKKPRIEAATKSTLSPLQASSTALTSPSEPYLLVDSNIVVFWKDSNGTDEIDQERQCKIAIAALVEDDILQQDNSDIRAEHLSFEKLLAILSDRDPQMVSTIQSRAHELEWADDENTNELGHFGIQTVEEFRTVISIFIWHVRRDGERNASLLLRVVEKEEKH